MGCLLHDNHAGPHQCSAPTPTRNLTLTLALTLTLTNPNPNPNPSPNLTPRFSAPMGPRVRKPKIKGENE